MANSFDFDGSINAEEIALGENVEAGGIVKTEDTLVIVDDVLESTLTSILGDISYS